MTEVSAAAAIGVMAAPDGTADTDEWRRRERVWARPLTMPWSYNTPNPAFTWGYMSSPAVPRGKIWEVLRYGVVAAPDPSVALAGVSMWAFISQQVPQDSNNPPGVINDVTAVAGAVPNEAYPVPKSVLLRQDERLVIGLKGLALNQQVVGSIAVIERDIATFFEYLGHS